MHLTESPSNYCTGSSVPPSFVRFNLSSDYGESFDLLFFRTMPPPLFDSLSLVARFRNCPTPFPRVRTPFFFLCRERSFIFRRICPPPLFPLDPYSFFSLESLFGPDEKSFSLLVPLPPSSPFYHRQDEDSSVICLSLPVGPFPLSLELSIPETWRGFPSNPSP